MEAVSNFLSAVPGPVALALMLGGFIFYALGCIRLGYGAAVKPTVLQLIEQALRHKGGAQLLELRLQVVQFALIFFKFDHDSILQFRNIIYSIAERSPPVKGNFLPVQLVKKVPPGFFAKLLSELQNEIL